jgi:alkylation response protein AidB-like acyl-CoA dehydrogenase
VSLLQHESAERSDYRDSFRTFVAREVVPAYPAWAAACRIPRELLRIAGEHGYLGMRVPEEHGGAGVEDPRFGTVVGEEAMLARVPALALVLVTHSEIALPAILRGAGHEWLPGLASGETLATVVQGEVAIDGDGRLRGGAPFVVSGTAADLFVVAAGEALVVVPSDSPGVQVEPSEPPVGLEAAGFATVRFDGARGVALSGSVEQLEIDQAVALAVTALAGARAALATTLEYVAERKAFGQPIAAFQNTRRELAAVAAQIEVGAGFVEASLTSGSAAMRTAAAGKVFCSELYGRAVDVGVQLHGGYGYMMEYEIAHAYADARFWRLYGARNEEMLDAVARSLFA